MIIADPKNREEWLNARKKGIGGGGAEGAPICSSRNN